LIILTASPDVLGKDSAKSALRILARDFKFDELPRHLPTFYSALGRMFGNDRGGIEQLRESSTENSALNSPSRQTPNYQDTLSAH
jgi:hypothetical protein